MPWSEINTCSTCRWFRLRAGEDNESPTAVGYCHGTPPQPIEGQENFEKPLNRRARCSQQDDCAMWELPVGL